jgi:hypothetical protein
MSTKSTTTGEPALRTRNIKSGFLRENCNPLVNTSRREYHIVKGTPGGDEMFNKNDLIFYTVASTIIAFITQALGMGIGWTFFLSLIIPPVILLAIRILR